MFEAIFAGGFFAGIVSTLLVLALINLRWSKKARKTSAQSLEANMLFKMQGK